ncbi:MAG: ABC transporter ATP-binding protein [Nitrospinota bacterium]|jgi:subfamily B ATP-binding cassette protein MsbA|nr:ABC transporter ATP-binding protein [Nitrospinota bacterium]MDP6618277.1 ABC transporter ATP-binding protein [Nitrospinota bacterium]
MNKYLRLLGYLKPYWRRCVLSGICMVVLGAVTAIPAYIAKDVIDGVFIAKNVRMLNLIVAVILLSYIVKGIFAYGQSYFMFWLSQRMVMDVRNHLYRHFHEMPLSFFVRKTSGELMSKITYDIALLQKASASGLRDLGQHTFGLLFLLGIAFYRDPYLSAVFVVVLPPLGLIIGRLGGKIRRITGRMQTQMGDINTAMKEAFQAARVVKAYNAEDHELARFSKRNRRFFGLTMKARRVRALSHPVVEILGGAGAAFILWAGGHQVLSGVRTPGEFISFLAALGLIMGPLKRLSRTYHTLQEGMAAADAVFGLMDESAALKTRRGGRAAPALQRSIQFERVSFRYEDAPVLQDVDIEILKGEVTAIVGQTGSGKTTLLDLVLGLYAPTSGRILWDGKDASEYDPASLRAHMAVVTQQTVLFHDTVAANIAYNLPDVPPERIEAAARAANAHGFISDLPEGYDTLIGEDGAKLSGGERQRLAIARAVLRDPVLLILDEATSALDSESERLVEEALNILMRDRTTLIVAHRLSSVRRAERILVLDEGRLIEQGTHDALLARKGLYARLLLLQSPILKPAREASPAGALGTN